MAHEPEGLCLIEHGQHQGNILGLKDTAISRGSEPGGKSLSLVVFFGGLRGQLDGVDDQLQVTWFGGRSERAPLKSNRWSGWFSVIVIGPSLGTMLPTVCNVPLLNAVQGA